jgi:hypothetical protein
MVSNDVWNYSTVAAFNAQLYEKLITAAHQVGERLPMNLGTKDDPDMHAFYQFRFDNKLYLLEDTCMEDLPILVTETRTKYHYRNVFEIITGYKSARFRPEHKFTFRQLVDDLCNFEHEAPKDLTLWKIMAFAATIGRVNFRVCSRPAFLKDSVMKVLGYLTSDICVISNPTVAKIEYRLITNKVLLLNEFAMLKAEDRHGMEHLLLSTGDMSNNYEKRSRATSGTTESINIGSLSIICAYNDLDCYPDETKYFDAVFSKQTKDRFIPFKFQGIAAQKIGHVANPEAIAAENADFLKDFIRSIMYYRKEWRNEFSKKRESWLHYVEWPEPKTAESYGLSSRWAENFDRLRDFVILYSESAEEANMLLNTLYNRHVEYLEQFENKKGLDKQYFTKQPEELEELHPVVEEVGM